MPALWTERAERRFRGAQTLAIAAAITAAVALRPAAVSAQTASAPEAVLITARPPDPVGNAAFSTVLIDASRLQTTPKLDAALREVPGLSYFRDFSTLAAVPSRVGVSVRNLISGGGVARALVTLDGVPQNDPWGDWVVPNSLPAENLSSVEIVRGAGAGPYGAGALTGVIELSESNTPGVLAGLEGGNLDQQRYSFVANTERGNLQLGASGIYGKSGGWFTVAPGQRGPVDQPVGMEAENLSAHAASELQGVLLSVRLGAYQLRRDLGLAGTVTDYKGVTGSATMVRPETDDTLGWRAQVWFRNSGFASDSVILDPERATAIPSVNEYATPALGWGGNAAVRGTFSWLDWEIGADARLNQGEARELSDWSSGAFQTSRFSGGRAFVGGIYSEAAARVDGLLITAGIRLDEWKNSGGHTVENSISSGAVLLRNDDNARSGAIPTMRAGIRKDFAGGFYLRTAAYEGFRQPSLNELFGATPQGDSFSDGNPGLEPERLYGAEFGAGGVAGPLSWNVTGFWNRLSGAIADVTLGIGPGVFPDVGFLGEGEFFSRRENVGYIDGLGSEGEAQLRVDDVVTFRAAFDVTDARVNGGTELPGLTGKRPAQTPRVSLSGGLILFPFPDVSVEVDAVYTGKRFSNDRNTLPIGGAAVFNATINWRFRPEAGIYLAFENIGNSRIAALESGDHVFLFEQPLAVRAGIIVSLAP